VSLNDSKFFPAVPGEKIPSLKLLNCNSERIPRSLLRGKRANIKKAEFLTVEDSLQLAAESFNSTKG
jgi:hypothetical protein